jgi:hypothetical protein
MSPVASKLTGVRLIGVLLLPWLFLTLFSYMAVRFVIPRVLEGQALAIVVGLFMVTVFASFCIAAVTFSRDVLSGQYAG